VQEFQYHLLARVEERHWWHRVLRDAIRRSLDEHRPQRSLSLLDVGCGTGGTLLSLAAEHPVAGVDISALALEYCKGRGLSRLAQASMEQLPFADDSFDVLVSIDSISHASVGSESQALREHRRVLRPGGLLILQASAFSWLHGKHDEAVQQRSRYTRREISGLMEEAGLTVLSARYRLSFLPPLMLLNNWILSRFRDEEENPDLALPSAFTNSLLYAAGRLDLACGGFLPFGSSVFCIGEK